MHFVVARSVPILFAKAHHTNVSLGEEYNQKAVPFLLDIVDQGS